MVRTLVKLFEELGGELRLSTPVKSVDLDAATKKHRIAAGKDGVEEFD